MEQFAQPLRVVIIGRPFTGKHLASKILSEKYGFKILQVDEKQQNKAAVTKLLFDDYRGRSVTVLEHFNYSILKNLKKRNFVNVILMEATSWKRYKNFITENKVEHTPQGLEKFIQEDDELPFEEYEKCLEFVRVRLINKSDINFIEDQIQQKKEEIIKAFRPSWKEYFMKMADIARRRSNCMKSSVGAVIVNDDNRVVCTGYNGTARGLTSCFKDGCERCNSNSNQSLDQCICLHAEESAIIEVGIGRTQGCSLYTTLYPCFSCAKVVKQAGITRIYFLEEYDKKDSGKEFIEANFKPEDVEQVKVQNIYY